MVDAPMTPPADPGPMSRPPRRPRSAGQRLFAVISSPRLAIGLLVAVLACSVAGVTIVKGEQAWAVIFNTLWFNGLLVALALSSGLTFFPRIWGRKPGLISVGMIVFHVCFLAMLGGVVFNSLFHFKGLMRLTEGEVLPNGEASSYDTYEAGRLFDFARLRGETTLLKMHRDYKVDGQDKRAAYEIRVTERDSVTDATIYVTQNLDRDGVRYLVTKEGYSIGVVLLDRQRRPLYSAMVPLQSLPQGPGTILYTTGSSKEPGAFPFPPPPQQAALLLQVAYVPDAQQDRAGRIEFSTWPPGTGAVPPRGDAPAAQAGAGARAAGAGSAHADQPLPPGAVHPPGGGAPPTGATAAGQRTGMVAVGATFESGDHLLEASEVRYWVGMTLRRDPGLTLILASLWAGLAGMTMTFVGRIIQDGKRSPRAASGAQDHTMTSRGDP
jgi:hypothetical protein